MALSRRTGSRFQGSIWPGFVDAMTGLLLVLMFVLTIFMVLQAVQTQRINGQESELNSLSGEVAALAQALGMERQNAADLETQLGSLTTSLTAARDKAAEQAAMIASLSATRDAQAVQLNAAEAKITGFETQVANLLSQRDAAVARGETLEARQKELLSAQDALNLALTQARSETDAQAEAARLAAARRDALTALVDDLRAKNQETQAALQSATDANAAALSDAEAARLAEAAAAEQLREKLQNADAELTAMTLALETQRQEAEDTLTLLAAARAAKETLDAELAAALTETETLEAAQADRAALRAKLADALAAKLAAESRAEDTRSDAEKRAALLNAARSELAQEEAATAAAQRQTELLNQQVAALRGQLGELQSLLDDAVARDAVKEVQLQSLGSDLNTALARVAAEERRRAELEAAERARLEAETKNLEQYRSEFFGRLRELLGNQEGVRIEGDRFVFSSEVLFPPGAATLSAEGRKEIAKVAGILRNIAADIPPEIDWVIRVDGHTDNQPLSGLGAFADNWELSQARALSVVKYMISFLGIAPERLAANGFGQYQPVANGNTETARAQNRRIELKLTEK
ncbi:MAG: peptidoglycan -binding protein [Sulfitobacter litoralis]|jgi:chemotaxis protein MotB|uniref:peptidoglycan -binding protein n=1 Tax=Sulfitobacter TaxID=60136 RepID=UPI001B64522A|nr:MULTISPECIES: peptidoglycan -binding protein [Sulfitobacter]MBQ0766205.1 peptidoglycan -binding protein [Sulfitobacter litoralis]MCF7725135.1 peptidoglycan -binding protein [Sulfitobacter sp. M22]MCF7776543.1 peptidoglycan -binding protein [Sulfitobacter sp. M220]|tara:strand:- start:48 stop:1796 length:1749 start_codon:yes stop_codon:yes gene_type:complete